MKDLPEKYRQCGQPVLMGGSMETGSYVLAGIPDGSNAFYTTAHGSGRVMSRHQAKKTYNGRELQKKMEKQGIYLETASLSALAEEAGGAYKNIDDVAVVTEKAGLSRIVAKLLPMGNIKG
jgi:tRNA-splicing ligase RtcB